MNLRSALAYCVLPVVLTSMHSAAQIRPEPKPLAKFSFNDKSDEDEISRKKIRLSAINFTADRFGNANSAVYFFGNEFSYINLGTGPELKPRKGTISLWAKVEEEVFSGKGTRTNPIILTKNSDRDDFYEAYAIYYFPHTRRISACAQSDSTAPCTLYGVEGFSKMQWHHLAITYDDENFSFYVDGELEGSVKKTFVSVFNPLDSVMLGTTANKKNNRFLNGAIDDVVFYHQVLNPQQIKDLYHAPNPNRFRVIVHWALAILGIVLLIYIIYVIIRYQLNITLKKEKQRLELYNIVLETELRVNRALMNPHFVFNSLNALQNFILKNENQRANNYLVKFSKLMRKILESNLSDAITLEFEIELLSRYLEIEDLRFEENIKHSIEVDPGLKPSTIKIPIMMIQPFVENAIWHGLLNKEGEKVLRLVFEPFQHKYLRCSIDDNGGGRPKEEVQHLDKKSLAIGFIKQRLELLNRLHGLNSTLEIIDKPNGTGTTVIILLPILNRLE